MQTLNKLSQRKHRMRPAGRLYRILTLFLILDLLLPASGVQAQTPVTAKAQELNIVTVDTVSIVMDGDTSSVQALLDNPGGEERVISFPEALTAVNRTGPGYTINFNLPHGATISLNSTLVLRVSNTTIDGDNVDGNTTPDVVLDAPNGIAPLAIRSSDNEIRSLAITGLEIDGAVAHHNLIAGCYIGTDVEGQAARPRAVHGITIKNGAHDNIIRNNFIAGNATTGYVGVFITGSNDNQILGNRIGINVAGTPLANNIGIWIDQGASRNIIGGVRPSSTCDDPCNIISGNTTNGVVIVGSGTISNVVQGNYIGVRQDGIAAPNGFPGIAVVFGASQNLIGGERASAVCDGPCNVISGNNQDGIILRDTNTNSNRVQGNYIGVSPDGTAARPNKTNGIWMNFGASHNTIGGERAPGSCVGTCNLISGNTGAGIRITGPTTQGNTIRGNDLRYNGGLGIDLGGDGFTANDPGDVDTGPNDLMNFPVDLRAVFDPNSNTTTIRGTLDTLNPTSAKVDIYNFKLVDPPSFSEGWKYLGAATPTPVPTNRDKFMFKLTVSGQLPLPYLSAAATNSNGSTSESCNPNPANPLADSDGDGLKDKDELNTHPAGNTMITLNLCDPDTDGDGLLDPWEVDPEKVPGGGFDLDSDGKPDDLNSNGIVDKKDRDIVFGPYAGQTRGIVDGALRLTGQYSLVNEPNPFHKDIYLEIDWQDCKVRGCPQIPIFGYPGDIDPTHHAPNVGALAQVINLFNQAPVQNPDGRGGIRLHILVDEGVEHTPICDKGDSDLRRTHFGTADQRIFNALINGNIIKAKERIFRYVATIHSTVQNGGCPEFGFLDVFPSGIGSAPLPAYDYTPFGNANVGGRDILVSLGPLWVCPQENTLLGFVPVCFRGITGLQVSVPPPHPAPTFTIPNPGLFPAKIVVNEQTQSFKWPMHMLLGLPSAHGSWQVWGRTLMHLLGHSLGLASEDDVKNVPDVPGFNPPETYGNWDNLQYAPKPGGTAPDESPPSYDAAHLEQDLDRDQVKEGQDNCPGMFNPGNPNQADLDGDGYGDVCDPDIDNDLLPNNIDFLTGPAKATDSVEPGDTTDPFPWDTDNDGMDNPVDGDDDNDGVPDASENCTLIANSSQVDTDGDGMGDGCDSDRDNDVLPDLVEQVTGSDPLNPASQSEFVGSNNLCADGVDNDLDGNVDGNDEGCVDTDGDTAPDYIDNCPDTPNEIFANYDSDDLGNDCDPDDDNDTVTDEVDLCPHTPVAALADAKGCSDADVDADGDSILDPFALSSGPSGATGFDNCPIVFNPDQADSDGNGIGDVCEPANLIIIKHVVNDNGGTAVAADFTMSMAGTNVSLTLFPGDEGGTTVTLSAGDYSVAETGPTGYTMSLSADCTGTIAAGETKTCTVTNDDMPPASSTYTLTDLGTLGGIVSYAQGINEAGQVIGTSYLEGDTSYHAFVWDNGVMTDLGTLGGSHSVPIAINEAGLVIGSSYVAGDARQHAFVWEDGVMTELTLGGSSGVPGSNSSTAVDINEAGQVVGHSWIEGDESYHGFVWEDGVITDIGTLGGSNSSTVDINEAGQVIGESWIEDDAGYHAFVWEDGVMTDLGTLGGINSRPIAINEAGQVIGVFQKSYAEYAPLHAFVWEDGAMTDLGTLGGSYSIPYAINEAGQIIGRSQIAGDTYYHAFLWEDGVMTDLGTLSGNNSNAVAINEAVQVIGRFRTDDTYPSHGFVWEDGVMTKLTLGGTYSYASGINEVGQVSGTSNLAGDGSQHAFVWEGGVMTDLGTFGGSYSVTNAINEAGQVIGHAYLADDIERHAFVATPATNTDIYIAGTKQESYYIAAHQSMRQSLAGVNNGPVRINNTQSTAMMAAERVIYKVKGVNISFSEMMGLPASQLNTTYWLPWYNNVDLDTQLRFANVSAAPATVHVYIGGTEMPDSPFSLAAGASTRQSFAGINNGPVKIVSDLPIVAAERVIYKVNGTPTSFSEMMGLPNSELNTTYWMPWYNNVDLDTQLRFANASNSPATVHVYIGGTEMAGSPFTLAVGESTRKSFPGMNNGPVKIESDVNIVAAERVIYKVNRVNTSFSEMMGLPASQLNTTYWLPWYNNVDLDTQLRFANVSSSPATVHVYIGGTEMPGSPFTLAAGASTRQSFAGINNGSVKIESNVNIVAAERVIYKVNGVSTSFSEMMALPNSQLDASYWLPWYNNVDLDTQLRFGIP